MISIKKQISLLLSATLMNMFLGGCSGDNNNNVVINPTPPTTDQKVVITADNIDAILATSVSGVDKISNLVDGLIDKLPSVRSKNRGLLDIDITTRDCAEGGTISVDKVTTSGATLSFDQCLENNNLIDGEMKFNKDDTTYDATFSNFAVTTNGDTISLVTATAHIVENDYDLFIASGTATVKGTQIDVQNFTLQKTGQQATANGSIKSSCVGGWIDITTEKPLEYDANGVLIGGQLFITGDNSNITVIIKNDGSIMVLLNGELYKEYENVDQLPQFSEICTTL